MKERYMVEMGRKKGEEEDVPIILPTPIPFISQEMGSSVVKRTFGIATCLGVSTSGIVAIGTSRGFVLIYLLNTHQHFVLGTQNAIDVYGSVCCLSVYGESLLVCGHEKGQVMFWDFLKKEVLSVVSDLFSSPVTQIVCLPNFENQVVCSDVSGKVFHLVVKKQMFGTFVEKTQIALKMNAPIIAIRALPSPSFSKAKQFSKNLPEHPTNKFALIAVANTQKVVILKLKPTASVCCTVKKPESAQEEALPCFTWKNVRDCDEKNPNTTPPHLLIAWGGSLLLLAAKLSLTEKKELKVDFKVVSRNTFREKQKTAFHKSHKKSSQSILQREEVSSQESERNKRALSPLQFPSHFSSPATLKKKLSQAALLPSPSSSSSLSFQKENTKKKRKKRNGEGSNEKEEKQDNQYNEGSEDESEEREEEEWGKEIEISGVEWLTRDYVLLYTNKHLLKVVNPVSGELLETTDVSSIKLVFHRHFHLYFPSNQGSYHNSIHSQNNVVYLLGTNNLFKANVLKWKERMESLVENKRWMEALSLSHLLLNDGIEMRFGLPSSEEERKRVAVQTIQKILLKFVRQTFCCLPPHSLLPTSSQAVRALHQVRLLASACIDYCIKIEDLELLFTEIYSHFVERKVEEVFLEMLEPYILSDKLRSLKPEVMKRFVESYERRGMVRRVEECIVHLDMLSIDFHQIVKLCEQFHLPTAFFYVYNKGLQDYITPLLQTFKILHKNPKEEVRVGYTILLYLSKCFLGEAFPSGEIPASLSFDVKIDVLNFLFQEFPANQVSSLFNKPDYPFLRILFEFDCKRTFEVFSLVFEDDSLSKENLIQPLQKIFLDRKRGEEGKAGKGGEDCLRVEEDPFRVEFYQRKQSEYWSNQQLYHFFFFASNQFSMKRCQLSSSAIQTILGFLTLCEDESNWEQRHLSLLNFVQNVSSDVYKKEKIQILANAASFYLVSQFFERKDRNFSQFLKTAIQASFKHDKYYFFRVARELLEDKTIESVEKETIKQNIMKELHTLIRLEATMTAQLIIDKFGVEDHKRMIVQLDSNPNFQFQYLKGIMEATGKNKREAPLLNSTKQFEVDAETAELYLRLLCQFEPNNVLSFLQSETLFGLEKALSLCKQFQMREGVVYLLERMGDVQSALVERLSLLESQLSTLDQFYSQQTCLPPNQNKQITNFVPKFPQESKVDSSVRGILALCKRSAKESGRNENNEEIWFTVVHSLLKQFNKFKMDNLSSSFTLKSYQVYFKNLMLYYLRETVTNMVGYVKLTRILEKLVNEHGEEQFGDFREIVMDILDTINYEKRTLSSVIKLLGADTHKNLQVLYNQSSKKNSKNMLTFF